MNILKKISVLCAFSVMLGTSGIAAKSSDASYPYKRMTSLIASVATGALMGKIAFGIDKAISKAPSIDKETGAAGTIILASWFLCFLIRSSMIACLSDVIWEEESVPKRPAMYSAAWFADWITYLTLGTL